MNLSDKITSFEEAMQVREIVALLYGGNKSEDCPDHPHYFRLPVNVASVSDNALGLRSSQYVPKAGWWVAREAARFNENREAYGEVLVNLWSAFGGYLVQFAPKPSATDKMKIDFFPDARSGMADRPITTSIGRFLVKVAPLVTESYVKAVDEAYRADMSNEIEILTGIDGLRHAYLEGPSSCMSKYWHDESLMPDAVKFDGHHPVDAYDHPGMGCAVTRDASGRINGRCMVYTNPDDETDKRFIRVYGDASLTRRLGRAGYKPRSFVGLTMAYIPLPKAGKNWVCFPYMDGVNGGHEASESGRWVLKLKGEDRMRILMNKFVRPIQDHLHRVNKWAGNVLMQGSSAGLSQIVEVDQEDLIATCAVTKKQYNLMEVVVDTVSVWHEGSVQAAVLDEDDQLLYSREVHRFDEHGNAETFQVNPAQADLPAMFELNGCYYAESKLTRKYLGYFPINDDLYPDQIERYVTINRYTSGWKAVDGFAYKNEDLMAVVAVDSDGVYEGTNNSYLRRQYDYIVKADFKEADFVRLHSVKRGEALYTHKRAKTYKTSTGRTVLPGFHDVVQTISGSWEFTRNCAAVTWLDRRTAYVLKGDVVDWDYILPDASAPKQHELTVLVDWLTGRASLSELRYTHVDAAAYKNAVFREFRNRMGRFTISTAPGAGTHSYLRWHGYSSDDDATYERYMPQLHALAAGHGGAHKAQVGHAKELLWLWNSMIPKFEAAYLEFVSGYYEVGSTGIDRALAAPARLPLTDDRVWYTPVVTHQESVLQAALVADVAYKLAHSAEVAAEEVADAVPVDGEWEPEVANATADALTDDIF
jgi:hypothetical protein